MRASLAGPPACRSDLAASECGRRACAAGHAATASPIARAEAVTLRPMLRVMLVTPFNRSMAALPGLGRHAFGQRIEPGERVEEIVEGGGHQLLGRLAGHRRGEAQLQVPLRIEPEGEGGFRLDVAR